VETTGTAHLFPSYREAYRCRASFCLCRLRLLNGIIKQVYEDVVHEVEKEVTEMKGVYSAHDVKAKVLDLLNKLKNET